MDLLLAGAWRHKIGMMPPRLDQKRRKSRKVRGVQLRVLSTRDRTVLSLDKFFIILKKIPEAEQRSHHEMNDSIQIYTGPTRRLAQESTRLNPPDILRATASP